MHTTWRAPVAWLLCFSARFVVLDTLLSSSLTPTTASPLHLRLSTPSPTRSFPPPYIYIHISSISLSLSLVESFSLHSKYSALPSRSRYLFFPYVSLSLSLATRSTPAISFPLDWAAHSEERNELKSTHSSPASRSFSPSSLDVQLPAVVLSRRREHSFLSLCLSASSSAAATRSQPAPSKRGGSGSKRIPLLPSLRPDRATILPKALCRFPD